jgi:soluble P-type ATPase
MITIEFNDERIELKYMLLDYTGTLSENGKLMEGIRERLEKLSKKFDRIEILTSDTFHSAEKELAGLNLNINILEGEAGHKKLERLRELGAEYCVAIGNGNNDVLMLKAARLSIAVINGDGCFARLINEADIVAKSTNDILDGLIDTRKIVSLLRK